MNPCLRDIQRFMSKLDKSGDCWLYKPGRSRYGQFSYQDQDTGFRIRMGAHRFSYMLEFGYIPDKMVVMHQCDNPKCCNPSHLRLGTYQDNTDDMMEKGRHPVMISKKARKIKSAALINKMLIMRQLRKIL
jgi:HNH endonuclease